MNPPKMPIHIGDYKRDTGHLRAAQHGAYLLLLFHYWSTGGLPDDDSQLAAITCMSRTEWKRTRPLIQAFFKDGWKHGRVDYDLDKAAKISQAASDAGKASGRSRSVKRPLNDRSSSVEPTLEPLDHRKEEEPADAGPSSATTYAFESGLIRLSEKDFSKWQAAFSHLDLKAELISMTEWAGKLGPSRWFFAVSNLLNNRNRDAMQAKKKSEEQPYKWNGIEGVV